MINSMISSKRTNIFVAIFAIITILISSCSITGNLTKNDENEKAQEVIARLEKEKQIEQNLTNSFGELVFKNLAIMCGSVHFQTACMDFARCSTYATLHNIPVTEYQGFIDSYYNQTNAQYWQEYIDTHPDIEELINTETEKCQKRANELINPSRQQTKQIQTPNIEVQIDKTPLE